MSTQEITGCPSSDRLRELLSGELVSSEQAPLTRHIESCSACQNTLDGWLSSPSMEGLASAGTDAATHEAALGELMAHLKKKPAGAPTETETIAPHGSQDAATPPSSESVTQAPGTEAEALAFLAVGTPPGQPARLGHYVIRGVVGQGGFGVVLKAFDEKLERIVAIKALLPAYAAVGSARKRFVREARTAAAIKNEHVVAIYGVQDDAQPPYLVMELIDGISLQDKIDKHGPLSVKEILRIGLQTAQGLAAAHKQGLVHRDIKPANILLENGVERVKITDFGLARAVDDASMTQSGTVAGTPIYMSPEQAGGLAVDHRSDLFSLGTVLYAMCTGHPPFRGSGTHAVLMRVIEDTPRPIREVNNEIPDWLEAIVAKLHAKKPEDRFQDAKEVAELLGQHLAHLQQPASVPAPAPVIVPARAASTGTLDKLLEGSDTTRRLLQHGGLSFAALLGFLGFLLVVFNPDLVWLGIGSFVIAGILGIGVARIKQRWEVAYRGHQIRFENCCFTGESLFIDDVRLARGGVGLRNEVRAIIPNGEAAGEEIVVFAESGLFSFHCRIIVEHAPAPARSARLAFAAKVQRVLLGAGAMAVVVMAVVACATIVALNNRPHAVALELDDPDIVVRVWPTAQTSPPVNLAGGFEILGEPAHVVKNSTRSMLFLPSGHYWLTAELDGQEVDRMFIHIQSNSLETYHIDVVGQNVSAGGKTEVGLPKVVTVLGAARLVQKEKNRLQGSWHAVAMVTDGKATPKETIDRDKPRFVFKGDRLTVPQNMPQMERIDEIYALNPRAKPGTLDLPKGLRDGKPMLAIYRWNGPNTLVICAGPQGRPLDFNSSPGSERVLLTLWRDNGVTGPDAEPGWVSLFNGQDLTGWVAPQPGRGEWHVDKLGQLVGKGDPRSYLFTQRDDFTDFHLRAELRVDGGSAGGICFRCGLNRLPLQLAPGYKASLSADPPKGSLLLTLPETESGKFVAIAAKTEFKASSWLTMEIIARGNRLTVKADGKTVTEYTDDKATYKSGRIALETYLPGTAISFKKVEIKELPHEELSWVKLFNGKDTKGWVEVYDKKKYATAPWDIVEPVLVLKGGKDQPTGYLRTEKQYREFHLRFEYKHTSFAPQQTTINSHVYWGLQGPDDPSTVGWILTPGSPYPKREDLGGGLELFTMTKDGKDWPDGVVFHGKNGINKDVPWTFLQGRESPADKWNRAEIISKSDELEFRINGAGKVIKGYRPQQGYIGLFSSEQGLHLRYIEIKELPPASSLP